MAHPALYQLVAVQIMFDKATVPSLGMRRSLLMLLMIGMLCGGCNDPGNQTPTDFRDQHLGTSQPPPTPTFDYDDSAYASAEDSSEPKREVEASPARDNEVAALLDQVRRLPDPIYRPVNTFVQVGALEGHRGAVLGLQVVGDEPQIVTHGVDATIRVWSPQKSVSTMTIPDISAKRVLASPDGRVLLVENQGSTRVVDSRSGSVVGTLPISGLMAISHDGKLALSQRSYDVVDVVDLATGVLRFELRGHKEQVQCARFSLDDNKIITGGGASDQTVRIWDSTNGKLIGRLQDPRMSKALAIGISPDGRLVAAVESLRITLWDLQTQRIYSQIENLPHDYAGFKGFTMVEFLDEAGTRLVATQDHMFAIIDTKTGQTIQTLKAHDNPIGVLGVSRDGAIIATGTSAMGGMGEPCKVWGAAGDTLATTHAGEIPAVIAVSVVATIMEQRGGVGPLLTSPDGTVLYAGTSNTALDGVAGGMVNAYDPRTGRLLRSFDSQIPRRVSRTTSLSLSADGKLLAMGTNAGDIVVWDATGIREIASSEAYSKEITGLTFLRGGSELVVLVRNEPHLPVLNPTTGQEIRRLWVPGPVLGGLCALHDGSGIIAGDTLIGVGDGQMIRRFEVRPRVLSAGLGASARGGVVAGVATAQGGAELRVWATSKDAPSASKRIGEVDAIELVRVSTGGSYVATVHRSAGTYALTIRESAALIEVAKLGLDGFAAVSDVVVDERMRTITVSGNARDGVLRFYKW